MVRGSMTDLVSKVVVASWRFFWPLLVVSWTILEPTCRHLGSSWRQDAFQQPKCPFSLGFLMVLGLALTSSWGLLGPSWGHLGASWGLLGPSWGHLGVSWGHLGPSWAILGPSWGHLGAIWGHLGAILGPSRGHLGPLRRHLGTTVGH